MASSRVFQLDPHFASDAHDVTQSQHGLGLFLDLR